MPRKYFYSIIIILILAILGGMAYFFFFANKSAPLGTGIVGENPFNPFSSGGGANSGQVNSNGNQNVQNNVPTNSGQTFVWPKVREIWQTPVGGFVASTTASSTFARFVDRGTGNVYDMDMNSSGPVKISNTTVPLVYESYWNGNAASGIFRYIKEGTDDVTNFYVELRASAILPHAALPAATSTATTTVPVQPVISETQYALRGAYFPGNIIDVAVSPKDNQIFTLENVNGEGIGYLSNFDGSGSKKVFTSPLIQLNAFWPTAGTLFVSTKASARTWGYLYSIDGKTGATSEVLGGLSGLSVLPNPTGNLVLYSDISSSGSLVTSLYNIKTSSSQDIPFVTVPEKCAWSRQSPLDLFCAVPSQAPTGMWPDDWYKGVASPSDRIWEIDTDTGNAHQVSDLIQDAKTSIDAEWLALDPKERFLYFVNKKDLSLWSVDLDQ